jgi:multicomponent Na+:H+ antiporter subunit E
VQGSPVVGPDTLSARRWAVTRRVLGLVLPPAVFWLLLSGHYTALLLAFGVLSVLIVVVIVRRMDVVDGTRFRVRLPLRAPLYAAWLAYQVLVSSAVVLRQVWTPRLAPHPAVGKTPVTGLSEVGTVAYANSITLTPGTLSLHLDEAGIEVHALRQADLDTLRSGGMLDRVRGLEAR